MALAEHVDPETWHAIIDGFFAILADGVHRFEGTINQYTGDGIMALFGAPIAHEDHAQRACYAALHLLDELARLRRRAAPRSRPELLCPHRHELRRSRGRQRSATICAWTIRRRATPSALRRAWRRLPRRTRVYLTEHTAALVGGYFRCDDLGEFRVKGVARAAAGLRSSRVSAPRARASTSRARADSRASSDATKRWRRSKRRSRTRRGAATAGDRRRRPKPASGKSRLCYEFAERCRAEGMPVLEAHCVRTADDSASAGARALARLLRRRRARRRAQPRARRSPARCCCSTRPSRRRCRWSSTSWAFPIRHRRPSLDPERAPRALFDACGACSGARRRERAVDR